LEGTIFSFKGPLGNRGPGEGLLGHKGFNTRFLWATRDKGLGAWGKKAPGGWAPLNGGGLRPPQGKWVNWLGGPLPKGFQSVGLGGKVPRELTNEGNPKWDLIAGIADFKGRALAEARLEGFGDGWEFLGPNQVPFLGSNNKGGKRTFISPKRAPGLGDNLEA